MTWVLSRQVPTQVSTQVGGLTTTCSGHWATLEAASDQFYQVILREPAAIKKIDRHSIGLQTEPRCTIRTL